MTDVLYTGRGESTNSPLYTVDPVTAAPTAVGSATGYALTGIAIDPTDNTMYAVTSNLSPGGTAKRLLTVDPVTGAATLVAALSPSDKIVDICFGPDGTLYGWDKTMAQLVSIDKATAAISAIGGSAVITGGGGFGLDYRLSDDQIYVIYNGLNNTLYSLDPTTGARTDHGTINNLSSASGTIGGASFGPNGLLWGVSTDNPSRLITLDVDSLDANGIGTMDHFDYDALAWTPPTGGGGDTTPPTRTGITAAGTTVLIDYDEPLQDTPGPDPSEFAVTVNGAARTVTAAVASGQRVTLTIDPPDLLKDDTVLVSYTA